MNSLPTHLVRLVRVTLWLVVGTLCLLAPTRSALAAPNADTDTEHSPNLVSEQTAYNLSSLPMITSQAGWGPVEINTSVGEQGAGDGQPMTINGQTFSHGFGTHAVSVISFDLEGKCSQFSSYVGIDDEVGFNGAAVFKVYADGNLLYESSILTGGNGAANTGTLNITGTNELMLVVEDAGLFYFDHANWAEPVVVCDSQPGGNGSSFNHIRGSWGPVLQWPVKAIHASLLPSGHILSHASSDPGQIGSNSPFAPHNMTKVDLSDINSWSHEWVDHPSEEMYCSAHTLLQDGSVFEFGGHGGANSVNLYYGQDQASRFDFDTKSWEIMADMQQARWYPTAITLGNGDVMAIGGSHAGGNSFKPEIFNGSSWRMLNNVDYQNRLNNNELIFDHTYPFVHLVSDGRLFWAGWDEYMAYIDPAGNGAWSQNYFRESQQRAWGAPVMYRVDKLLLVGGIDHQGNYGLATKSVKHIDLTGGSPSTTDSAPMLFPRADVDGTVLANGDVLVNGGGYEHILGSHPTHIYVPEIWDPSTNQWTIGAAATNPRGYHSTTLLLPDGRVWTGGGECGDNCDKGKTAQVYSPPYLYKQDGSGQLAPRPVLTNVDSQAFYGQSFNANVSTANNISKVTFIRLGSSTHHINFEQRYLELGFQKSGSQLTIQAPNNGNLAPPGYYMLFALDSNGVPSVAKMVQLVQSGTTPPPTPIPTAVSPQPTNIPPGGACNLVTNGSFQNGLSGWSNNGTLSVTGSGAGDSAGLSVQNGWAGQIVPGSGGTAYTLSGQYQRLGNAAWVSVGVDFLNNVGVEIGEAQTPLSPASSYSSFTVNGVAPAGTTQIQIWLFASGSDTLLVDNIDLSPATCNAPQPTATTPPANPTATSIPPTATTAPANPTATPIPPTATTAAATATVSVPTATTAAPISCDLLNNSNFENGLSGWVQNGSLALTSDAFEGGSALDVQSGWAGQIVPGSAGETYTLSGKYKRIGSSSWVGVGFDFFNSSGSEIGEALTILDASSSYADFTVSGSAPAGTAQIQVWLFNGGDSLIIDQVNLLPANCNTPPPPVAPNTPTPPPTATPQPQPPTTSGGILYVSSTSGGNVNGVQFGDEDILAYDTDSGTWSLFVDGSDIGLNASGSFDINAFHIRPSGDILMSVVGSGTLAGVGSVDDSDILLFTPTSTGPNTAGSLSLYFDGSDVLLTTSGEDIDALYETPSGQLIISTIGSSNVGFGRADEDLLIFTPSSLSSLGANTSGTWDTYFDGSDIALNNSGEEDIWGISINGSDLYLTTRGVFNAQGIGGQQADILACLGVSTGNTSSCGSAAIYWDGDGVGFSSERIDGIHVQVP